MEEMIYDIEYDKLMSLLEEEARERVIEREFYDDLLMEQREQM